MKFYKYLYAGETVEHVGILKQKLKIHAMVRVYLVKHAPIIIGIASNYEEAVAIVQKIVEESLERTGTCDLKEYLKLKVKDQKKGS